MRSSGSAPLRDRSGCPYSHKVLLENLLRTEDGANVTADQIRALGNWDASALPTEEIQFTPARVIMQDFTGVPCVVDLATMREAVAELGGDAAQINPLAPAELVIDHPSLRTSSGPTRRWISMSRWNTNAMRSATSSCVGARVPSTNLRSSARNRIVHQVNIESLARVVMTRNGQAYPDTCVGTEHDDGEWTRRLGLGCRWHRG